MASTSSTGGEQYLCHNVTYKVKSRAVSITGNITRNFSNLWLIDGQISLFVLENMLFYATNGLLIECFNLCQIGNIAHVPVNLAYAMNSLHVTV